MGAISWNLLDFTGISLASEQGGSVLNFELG